MVALDDPLHGRIVIDDPTLEALMQSAALQRLRDVEMGGYAKAFFPGTRYSRFEHAVGVCVLLRQAGAGLEEQIHGLLHDVNHSVFSHAADYALPGGSEEQQSHQDESFLSFLSESAIPGQLLEAGFDPERILDPGNFPLAETEIPDLCADRLDYGFRTMLHHRTEPREKILGMLQALRNDGSRWFFDELSAAAAFATAFHRINEQVMSAFPSAVMFRAIGDCLKVAMERGFLTLGDLYGRETQVLAKLEAAVRQDPVIERHWRRMSGQIPAVPSEEAEALTASCKSRVVDPLFKAGGQDLCRLSQAVPDWGQVVTDGRQAKHYRFRFLD